MSLDKLSPKELMATNASIPMTMDEIKSMSLAIFFRKSRKAMIKVQVNLCITSLLNSTSLDPYDPVGSCSQSYIMSNQNQCGAQCFIHVKNKVFNHHSSFCIQIAGRLVCKKNLGLIGKGSGDRHPLLFTSRQL